MPTITRFEHPDSLSAPGMFVLRAEADIGADTLLSTVGDLDMYESAELAFSFAMFPQYYRQVRLVASDHATPATERDVLGVATIDLPTADNLRLATVTVAVRHDRRREGIGSTLHGAALEVAAESNRTTIQTWTWEPLTIPENARVLAAETGSGGVDADSAASRFLTGRGYVLGQFERISRMELPPREELLRQRDAALANLPAEYEMITLRDGTPEDYRDEVARLSVDMSADAPSGALDTQEEVWDAERVRLFDVQMETAGRDQLQSVAKHIPSGHLVGFTRLVRDRARPLVGHQWDTIVAKQHRGHGLGMTMKLVNHAAVGEIWPETRRLVTGNAAENSHMLAINTTLGFQPYAANGFWELRRDADR